MKINHLDDPGIDRRIMLKLILKSRFGVSWINVAEDCDKLWVCVHIIVRLLQKDFAVWSNLFLI
jgi:hypothetical protein